MQDTKSIARIRRKYRALSVEMDERGRRQWAAAEARELGWGGVTAVAHATGVSRTTITAGRRELELPAQQASGRRDAGTPAGRWTQSTEEALAC